MTHLDLKDGDIGLDWDKTGIDLKVLKLAPLRITASDLYFSAPARFDPLSGQRLGSTLDDPADVDIHALEPSGDRISIRFDTGEELDLSTDDLLSRIAPAASEPEPVLWDRELATSLPEFNYRDFFMKTERQRQALLNLVRYGFVRLTGAPLQPFEIEHVVAAFGQIRETNYGRLFDVRTKPDPENLAYSDRGLEVHTDNPYRDPVPGLQILHCLANADKGGETCLVDGFKAAMDLKAAEPEAFERLAKTPCLFRWRDDKTWLETIAPILTSDGSGKLRMIRFNHRSFAEVQARPQDQPLWRNAHRALAKRLSSSKLSYSFRLNPGDVLIMDNHRILHGRTAFDGAQQGRCLKGGYAEKDGLRSRLRLLTRMRG